MSTTHLILNTSPSPYLPYTLTPHHRRSSHITDSQPFYLIIPFIKSQHSPSSDLSLSLSMDAQLTDSVTVTPPSRTPPVREDCWSEEATATLIDAWGRRYLELNRGNLRQKDWQEVADAVNALHGHTKKTHRTDVQCKNRIDTIKKKYKVEKQRVLSSDDVGNRYVSSWRFFDKMDFLIGNKNLNLKAKPSSSPPSLPVGLPLPYKRGASSSPATGKVVVPPLKRAAGVGDGGYFRRNFSAMAAAAAAAEAKAIEDEEEDEEVEEEGKGSGSCYEVEKEGNVEGDGFRRLAKAIEGFGKLYERVEVAKLRQLLEMEKQRMQFEKDMELQRMQMFMDTQVQLERIRSRK